MREKMEAVVIDRYGDNGVVTCREVARPEPGDGEVLVRVRAAGVNPVDWKIRNGAGERLGLSLPIRLGSEFSGVVEQLGRGVANLNAGDAVYGIVPSGAFAGHALARAADLARKPGNLDFIQSAAVPLGALTAWQAMFDLAGLQQGQRLLVTNGSGGVGSLAIQLARAAGAHVTAVAPARNEAYVRSLGADAFIDHTAQPFEQVAHGMDVVFDTVGGDAFARAFATLKQGGVLVTSVAFPQDADLRRGVKVARVQCKPDARQLASIAGLVDAGKLKPHVETVFPLAGVREALTLSERGHVRGKIVLDLGA